MEIPFSQSIMYGALGSTLVIVILGILVLLHHWNYYGIKGNKKIGIKFIFFFGIIFFLMIEIILIVLYGSLT